MSRTRGGLLWLTASLAGAALLTWIGWQRAPENEPGVVNALVWTGRAAFLVFLLPLFASPLRALARNPFTACLVRWRRNAGIAYGGIQVVHLGLIVVLLAWTDSPPVEAAMLVVGGLGIVLAMGMLVTSFEGPATALGRRGWRIVHRAGFHVFMFIYFYDFVVEPALLGTTAVYAPFAILTLGGMALRTLVLVRRRATVVIA